MAILSVLAAATFAAVLGWLALNRPYLIVLFIFFLFAAAWRVVSALYIDVAGPVRSEQLSRSVGPGIAAVPLVLSYLLILLATVIVFRRNRIRRLLSRPRIGYSVATGSPTVQDVAFVFAGLFSLALWLQFLWIGHIPFFSGLERFDYTEQYGGVFHAMLMEYGPMYALILGVFCCAPFLRGQGFDQRFIGLVAALFLYLFLAGHRFSAFYSYGSFFLVPVGAIFMLGLEQVDNVAFRSAVQRFSRGLLAGSVILVAAVGLALHRSYTVTRAGSASGFLDRLLVQQSEMWWLTFERVFSAGSWSFSESADFIFLNPIEPLRNTTIQYLMARAIPDRVHEVLNTGTQYAGGFPEIMFELGGIWIGLGLVFLFGLLLAEYMFFLVSCFLQERFASTVLLTAILYTLAVTFVGGMLNSYVVWTFAIKVSITAIVVQLEARWCFLSLRHSDALRADSSIDPLTES
jgi:hypothetical protein